MTAQGPELRALADTLRVAAVSGGSGLHFVTLTSSEVEVLLSALERAAAAEGEKAKAWDEGWEAARADVWNRKDEGTYRITPNPYRSAS